MLNIGKLAAGGEDYYLARVASTVEDYYTGKGEAPGKWIGGGAAALSLRGVVSPPVLRAVLNGLHPSDGAQLLAQSQRRIPGFDLTFRAPKSVSLLWALGPPETSLEVKRAHDKAVAESLRYLERHAAFTRRGHGGVEQVPTDGFVGAAFRHRTSRADDPLLHTHVLVANLGHTTDDDTWRTLDARHLYLHAKTAGYLYQAQLRQELSRELGVDWGPVRNGYADIAGVPRAVIEAFSRRRSEILAVLEERGESSAKAAQVATLATRKPKSGTPKQALHERWRERADELGFDDRCVAQLTRQEVALRPEPDELREDLDGLLAATGLTASRSTFDRRDVLQRWCDLLPAGADVGDVERLADWLLHPDRHDVVPLDDPDEPVTRIDAAHAIRTSDGRLIPVQGGYARYSTAELLALEQRLVDQAAARADARVAVVPKSVLRTALDAYPSLTDEQAAAVRRLTRSGAGVDVVVGKAGTGKTFMLAAAHEAWRLAGIRVLGSSLAARAALELQAGSGVPSSTIESLLEAMQRPGGGLPRRSVLVIDEAGMVGTRTLARLLDEAADAKSKVVLVGDHRQLPEIDAGGTFAGLVNRLPAVELTVNQRQLEGWERDALDELRDGEIADAVDAYSAHDRVTANDDPQVVRQQLVGDWWRAVSEHGLDAVMVAVRRTEVAQLNRLARTHMAAEGELTGPELRTVDRTFQRGDRIVCLRNRRRLNLLNGTRGTVTAVDADAGTLAFVPHGADRPLEVPAWYLKDGYVDHGYALTAHKAQGLTCDLTFVLANDAVYREWGYVALSRGRHGNQLYAIGELDLDRRDDPTHPEMHEPDHPDAISGLTARLRRSQRQALALDHLPGGSVDDTRTRIAADRDRAATRGRDRAIGLG